MTDTPIIGFHLDLKYMMPDKRYLTGPWLEHLAELGVNTLLIEYEDKFPWKKYPFIQAEGAFTPQELRTFLGNARKLGIQTIPLVQTLAHLEFALAHDQLSHLREMPDIFTHICPANPEAIQFVHGLIDEVLEYHQDDAYFHLGADEAHYTGTNPLTKPKLEKLGKVGYWADHLKQFIDQIKRHGKRAIVWDDIFWPNPQAINEVDLPRDVILHCWDYIILRSVDHETYSVFNPSGGAAEYGSVAAAAKFKDRVATYRKAGYEILSAPCLNWGVLTPQHKHCLENTAGWEGITRPYGSLGMINTAWQSFHTMLPTYWPYIEATSQLVRSKTGLLDPTWEVKFLEREFGVSSALAGDVPDALQALGELWEQRIEGLNRPITPIVYGYMDMILYWPTADQRAKRSAYPRNWNDVDFVAVYRRKLKLLRENPEQASIRGKLDNLTPRYDQAAKVLAKLAASAKRHTQEAEVLAVYARFKALFARIIRLEVYGEGNRRELSVAMEAIRPELSKGIKPFVEPVSHDRLMRVWWEPAAVTLKAGA